MKLSTAFLGSVFYISDNHLVQFTPWCH